MRVDRVDVLAREVVRPDLDVVELREAAAKSDPTAPQPTTQTLTACLFQT